jgi:hypothetical protein
MQFDNPYDIVIAQIGGITENVTEKIMAALSRYRKPFCLQDPVELDPSRSTPLLTILMSDALISVPVLVVPLSKSIRNDSIYVISTCIR